MSYDQQDLTNRNNVEGASKLARLLGNKTGRGRGVFAALPLATNGTVAAHGTGLIVPKGSSVTRCVYKSLTSFTSLNSTATLALSLVAANDIVSAAALSTNVFNASIPIVCIPVTATLSTWLHTTADSELTATVAVEALTAGKMVVFAEWFYWGDLTLT